jgi:acyl-CoA reductase-like NAD-dependent aldehyde dehydrogenase
MTTTQETAASIRIGASWLHASDGAGFARCNPARASDVTGRYAEAGAADVDAAVRAGREAQAGWDRRGPIERGRVLAAAADGLRARADEIGAVLTREEGKPLAEARGEVLRAADVFDYFAGEASRPTGIVLPSYRPATSIRTTRYPVGVVGIITPFNFPAFIPALKLGPALLAGNSVLWKPAPATPGTGMLVVDVLTEAGLPPGILSYLTGSTGELGQTLVAHPGVDAISFTGSTPVGRAIGQAAAARHARVQQEMGGKNSFVVLADADLDRAIAMAAESAFGGSGQKCTSAGRILVERSVAGDVIDGLVQRARELRVGDGAVAGTEIGPLVDGGAQRRVSGLVEDALAAGARLASERREEAGWGDGHFVAPAVLTDVVPGMRVFEEETFGPVAAVTVVDDLDEAIALTLGTDYGLCAAVHTTDLAAATRFADEVRVGVVNVNQTTSGVEPHAPFGGVGHSGSPHRELGPQALDFYTLEQTQVIAT